MDKEIAPCIDQALRYLSIREHNRKELALKLKNKGYEKSVIERTLDNLEEDGSLSEERYVEAFVRSSNRRHPEGRSVMAARLLAKGADREVCNQVLDRVYTHEYVLSLLEKAGLKKDRNALLKAGFRSADIGEFLLSNEGKMD